jgi:hypothetical protein
VGPGTVLGGRYALRRRLDDDTASSTWQANDETLERSVHVLAVAGDNPHAEAVLDAARRAVVVEDPRLVRILDVGHDQTATNVVTYVVTEWLGGTSLAAALQQGPLEPETARTVVGACATALEAARRRGLHHLRLVPELVQLLDGGGVKVLGLATAAALDGTDSTDGTDGSDVAPAGGDPAGNPTSNPGSNPAGSADRATSADTRGLVAIAYAALTATWPLGPGEGAPSGLPRAPRVAGRPVAPSQIVTGAPADLDTLCAQTFAGAGAPSTPGALAAQIAPWGRERRTERPTGSFPHALPPSRRPAVVAPTPSAAPAARTVPAARTATPAPAAAAAPAAASAPERPSAAEPAPAGERGPAATGPLPVAGRSAPARPAADGSLAPWFAERATPGGHDAGVPDAVLPGSAGIGGRRVGTVIALVIAFVAVFVLLAYCGLRGLGDNAFVPGPRSSSAPATSAPPRPPTASGTPSSSPSSPPVSGPITVRAARGFDPQGDGSEHDAQARLAIDGKASTSWTSDIYRTAAFGGLKKGLGLELDLAAPSTVTSVQVRLGGSGYDLELRTADGSTLGSSVLASVQDASGVITLTPRSPVRASTLVLWFTRAAPNGSGYGLDVADVVVR